MTKNHAHRHPQKAFMLIVALLLGLLATSLYASEYGRYDLKRIAQPKAQSGTGATLDMAYLDSILADLRQHAGNYPPKFDAAVGKLIEAVRAGKVDGRKAGA